MYVFSRADTRPILSSSTLAKEVARMRVDGYATKACNLLEECRRERVRERHVGTSCKGCAPRISNRCDTFITALNNHI